MTFIITLIILYLLWLLLKPLLMNYARRKYQQKVNDMFNQAFGGGTGAASGNPFGSSYASSAGQRNAPPRYKQGRKKKIFSRDEGEYIEFEEIEVTTEYRYTSSSDPKYTPREPQVSDADWEEIR
ncbi:MAG: DUF4834 family protein [Duncaniella sp.]|nr:DUF4834 family protein [Bacteroides sp.]MDE5828157.1 DUF4834 family protein [Duncaniella sp.]MBD5300018.1 DUF4834 family protein [Bacteroides sp.]MBD5353612.1 DUF4834 family protein [Bacteroides sp.]MDE6429730.1 DUF4834 family protein [Duncaniella sp.]